MQKSKLQRITDSEIAKMQNSRFGIWPACAGRHLAFSILLLPIAYCLLPKTAYAVCPVCTVAVAAGLGLSRFLGIDDTVSGIWIGALILSSSFWLVDWLEKKFKFKSKFKYTAIPTVILMYLLVLLPLTWTNIIGHPFNKILGIDKLLFGSGIGSLIFLSAVWADKKVRKIRGKQLFKYQKVVFPVAGLVIGSLIMYLLTKH